MTFYSGKLRACACTFKWCSDIRERHFFRDCTVQMPIVLLEIEVWTNLLGLEDVKPSDRISIIHFFQVDIMIKSSILGQASFDTIDRNTPTKYQLTDTGNFSRTSPPRPAASKHDIENSIFYGISALTYSDYLLLASLWRKSASTSCKKRNVPTASATTELMSHLFSNFLGSSESMKAGRQSEIPLSCDYSLFI